MEDHFRRQNPQDFDADGRDDFRAHPFASLGRRTDELDDFEAATKRRRLDFDEVARIYPDSPQKSRGKLKPLAYSFYLSEFRV